MKKVAVLQSNYIPWKGYFDIIHDADEFVFYDEVQYTKRDWRSRNIIPTKEGPLWLSVPAGNYRGAAIDQVPLKESAWQQRHCETLRRNYAKAPYFREYAALLEDLYLSRAWTSLSDMNQYIIRAICGALGVETKFSDSREYASSGQKHEKLLSLVKSAGASVYISGPAAKEYLVEDDFTSAGIRVVWKDYGGYPEYKQLYEPFDHYVSILDLLFNTGPDAPWYIWGWREGDKDVR